MPPVVSALLAFVIALFRAHAALHLENLALRHQLAVYRQTVHRPPLRPTDRRVLGSGSPDSGRAGTRPWLFVQPRTVIAWQHKRFRDHWRRLSQQWHARPTPHCARGSRAHPAHVAGQSHLECAADCWGIAETRDRWGEIHGGKVPSAPTEAPLAVVEDFLDKATCRIVVSLDFFTVPTVTYKVLFVLVILAHKRRRVVHFNITEHPTAQWTVQQVVEAFPWDEAPRYLLRDRDRIYGTTFRQRVKHMGINEVVIAPRSVAESVCRAPHWEHPAGMSRAYHYPQCRASPAHPGQLLCLLSSLEDPSVAGDGLSRAAPRCAS